MWGSYQPCHTRDDAKVGEDKAGKLVSKFLSRRCILGMHRRLTPTWHELVEHDSCTAG